MPQIGNDKQISIAKDSNNRTLAKLMQLKEVAASEERYSMLTAAAEAIDKINVNYLDDPDVVIDDYLYSVAGILALNHKEEAKSKALETFVTSVIKKNVEIFAVRTKRAEPLSFISKLLNKKGILFYKPSGRSSVITFYASVSSQNQPNKFYHECVANVLKELSKYHKIVWELQLKELIDLVHFINIIQPSHVHSKEGVELMEALTTELLAFYKSGRPELAKFCNSISSMKTLDEYLLKKVDKQSMVRYISELGPTLAETFLQSPERDLKKAGLNLMQRYIDQYSYQRFNKYKESDWKTWVNKHEIYELVFSDFKFCDEVVEKNYTFFKYLRRYKANEERTVILINLLKKNIEGCQKFSSYICKELDCYFLDSKSKEILLEFLSTITKYSQIPYYFQTLQDLPTRNESDAFVEKAYNLILRIMKEDYQKLAESQRHKCLSAFKYIFNNKYGSVFKSKNADSKQKILKESIIDLFSEINSTKILIFNLTVIDGEMWKALSNTTFQNLLTDLVDKCQYFDNIFKYLEKMNISKINEKDFVKIIKFVTSKIVSKQDAIFKYIHVISKFPDIFEELIESSGYSQLEQLFKKVIQLFKENPETPFHILTLTFERINHNNFSDYNKTPSLLQDKKQQKELNKSPKNLKFFDNITDLILETDHEGLRSELCNFVLSLYVNFKHSKYYSHLHDSGEETFIAFLTDLLEIFGKDYQQFLSNPSMIKVILVDLVLIEKALQFTDTLGCGGFKPHKSLVSTSTILLSVANNVTFGDDVAKLVHRDFPSSMILFDALTIIGMQFKCGPENIVLKQNGRFISPIYNSCSLEDLNLTNDEIIAQQNSSNSLQTPQLFESKPVNDYKSTPKLKPEIIKIITDVFNRFAFEGKMSLLQCTNYVRQASGSECISSDRRVKDVFELDSDKDGIITLPDFVEYYKKNLTYGSYYKEQMLKGLFNLRYRKNLTLYNEPLDISNQYYLMMRFKIAKSYQNIYDILFSLAKHHESVLSSKAKNLLLFLPSYPKLKSQIGQLLNFNQNSEFEIYYKLISVENELNAVEGAENLMEAKQAKIQQFVKNKNNEIIFMLLSQYHSQPKKSQFQEKSLLICLRILRSLINIEYLSTSSIYKWKFDKIFIPNLPATNYFAEHTALAYHSRNIINFETLLVLQLTQQHVDLGSIVTCCFNHEEEVRKISCNFVYLWSLKTKFAFDLFTVKIAEEYNEEWFELLCGIIQQNSAINLEILKNIALSILEKRQQSFQNPYDPLMYGYLKILSSIAKKQRFINPKIEELFTHLLNNSFSAKNRSLIFELIRNQKREIGYAYFDRMLSTILPSQECLIRQKYVGIKNLGAICYINSILQQFFMIDKFKNMVLNKNVPKDIEPVEVNGKLIVDDFMFQLQKLYHHLEYSKKKYIIPKDFCLSYKNFEGQPINTSIQEDAHEFLNRLIESAEEAFKKEDQLAQFQELLNIKKLSEIECQVCKNRIDKFERDYCLTIEVKNHDSLVDSLRKFTEREEIADYFCEKCNKKMNKIFKRTYLNELPEIVILNLQRIVYDQSKGDKVKVHTQLSFPQAINFADFVKNDNPTLPTDYNLKGVVIHTGTSEGGHYYSLIKTRQYGWLKFNDQSVTPFDEKDIERETFGGFEGKDGWGDVTYSTNAYILFYQRSGAKPKEFIEAENQFTEELQKENTRLINQLQIHQESFFKAIIESYEMVRPDKFDEINQVLPFMQTKPSKERQREYLELIKIVQKAFSFLNVYTEIKQQIRVKISVILRELYFILPEETVPYFKECNINTYFQNIISDSTHNERETLKQTFLQLLMIHIRYYGINLAIKTEQNQYVFDILDKALSYMQSKLFYSNITKVFSYLHFWELLMKKEKNACFYLFQNNYFLKLVDLIMGKESPFMKHHPIAQDLPVNLVPFVFSSIDYLLEFKLNLKGKKLFEHSAVPTSSLQAHILTNPNFYRRIMRLKYDNPSLSHIIIHYSTNDLEFSAIIAEFLITSLNNRDQVLDLPLLFKHIRDFLMIKDGLQAIRYGWILGLAQNKESSPGTDDYCLSYSDRSDCVRYISGLNLKRGLNNNDNRRPLLDIAFEKRMADSLAITFIFKILLELVIESDTAFDYMVTMPPPNYHCMTYFDWIPTYASTLSKDSDFILQKKLETFEELKNMLEIVKEKVKLVEKLLPVQKYIIGKTKQLEIVDRLVEKSYEVVLKKLKTYVLENKPTGEENESMPKKYFSSQNPYGIGHAFIHYRSKMGYESETKDLKAIDTLYILTGKTQKRLVLIFKGKLFRHHILVSEGEFVIVFPVEKYGKIEELVDILPALEERVEVIPEELEKAFAVEKKEEGQIMQQEKGDFNPALPAAAGFIEPKIKCSFCTYDNELTRDHCEMCDNPLFS